MAEVGTADAIQLKEEAFLRENIHHSRINDLLHHQHKLTAKRAK